MPWNPYPTVTGGARPATLVVAASNSSAKGKETADYVCDGISDQEEINSALSALGTGGCVLLLEGTYIVDGYINVPSNAALIGQGWGTVIVQNEMLRVIQNADQANGNTKIVIRDLAIDGASKARRGIYLYQTTYSLVSGLLISNIDGYGILLESGSNNSITENTCQGSAFSNIYIYNEPNDSIINNICQGSSYEDGILVSSSNDSIIGNRCQGNGYSGIELYGSDNSLIGNICQGNGIYGICLDHASKNSIVGNICQGNFEAGIYSDYSSNNNITGNTCRMNSCYGIYLMRSSNNNIIGNTCLENSQESDATYDNIQIDYNSDYNNIQANTCRQGALTNKPKYGICIWSSDCNGNLVTNNDLYKGGVTGAFADAGTGTVTTAGNRLA